MLFKVRKIAQIFWSPLSALVLIGSVNAQEPQITGKNKAISVNSAPSLDPREISGETTQEIAFVEGKLSANLKNAEFASVLLEIGMAVKARVDIGGDIPSNISLSFSNLSLEEGLATLIKGEGKGIVLCYDKNGAVTLISVSKRAGMKPEQVFKVTSVRL